MPSDSGETGAGRVGKAGEKPPRPITVAGRKPPPSNTVPRARLADLDELAHAGADQALVLENQDRERRVGHESRPQMDLLVAQPRGPPPFRLLSGSPHPTPGGGPVRT